MSDVLSISSKLCRSTKHSYEQRGARGGYAKAEEVPQDLILFADPSLSLCQSNTASPGAQAREEGGRYGACCWVSYHTRCPHVPPRPAPAPHELSRLIRLCQADLGSSRSQSESVTDAAEMGFNIPLGS